MAGCLLYLWMRQGGHCTDRGGLSLRVMGLGQWRGCLTSPVFPLTEGRLGGAVRHAHGEAG